MIDMHSHFLPQIDDGSRSVEETFQMIKEASKAGFTAIVSTSHYIANTYDFNKEERREIINAISSNLSKENIDIKLYNGAEVYIDADITGKIKDGIIPKVNNSKYLLMELPMQNRMLSADDIIHNLLSNNIVPIIAHPERYKYVQDNPNVLISYIEKGVLFQANFASIIGYYGNATKKTVIKLLQNDMIHCLGTDCHRAQTIYVNMDKILEHLNKILPKKEIEKLTTINPMKIVNNQEIKINFSNRI